jgi:hypothetical protein
MMYADSHCTYDETCKPVHGYTFTGPCVVTGEPYSVFIPAPELFAYRRGDKIQDAMPSVKPEDREFLMSGTSPEGWNQVFGPEEDEFFDDEDDTNDD